MVNRYQQLPVFLSAGAPSLERTLLSQVACGGKDTASPHTSDIRLWRRWAALYPTHRVVAHGGDGHRIISQIGHQLMEGMGTALSHTSGISSWRDGHLVLPAGWTVMRYRAPLSSSPRCGLLVPTITGLPQRRGSCLRADTVVSSSLWREGHSITSHISHPSVEEVGIALSHTSGSSLWRGWAPHYPTHWASACGGDGHRIIPHIRHQLVERMGTIVSHTSGISSWRGWAQCPSTYWAGLPGSGWLLCNGWVAPPGSSSHDHKRVMLCIHPRSFAAGRGQSPWFAISMGTGRERHLCVNMVLFGQALFWCIGVQVVSLC